MNFIEWSEAENKGQAETLKLGNHRASGSFVMYTGKSGDYVVSIMPSLNVSGYGATENEAREDLKHNLDVFFEDIFAVDEVSRMLYLKNLGWTTQKYFKRKFSKAYVDENGVLQNFDNPEEVKKNIYQAA